VAVSASSRAFYKRVRNRMALLLAVAWVVLWYFYFDAQRLQEIHNMELCKSGTGLKATACAGVDFVLPAETMSGVTFSLDMVLIAILSPLMFLPARVLARRYVAFAEWRGVRQEQAAQARWQRQQQRESEARLARSEAEAGSALRQISRGEIIHKLGAVSDLTDLLQAEADAERLMNIRHGVAQALRELAAKYTVGELAALIKSDAVVQHAARTVVTRLDASPLRTIVEIQALRIAVK
jgi:hypothetical protein